MLGEGPLAAYNGADGVALIAGKISAAIFLERCKFVLVYLSEPTEDNHEDRESAWSGRRLRRPLAREQAPRDGAFLMAQRSICLCAPSAPCIVVNEVPRCF